MVPACTAATLLIAVLAAFADFRVTDPVVHPSLGSLGAGAGSGDKKRRENLWNERKLA